MNRVVLTTGGTGGHIFPALAVAEELRRRNPDVQLLFVGGNYGPERRIVQAAGIDFVGFPVRGLMGRGVKAFLAAGLIGLSVLRSIFLLRKFKPEIVVGFGGYAGFAPVMAATILGLPTAVHEQNSFPGKTNVVLAKRVDRVFLSMPDDHELFPKEKVLETGNPVRESIRMLGDMPANVPAGREVRILVIGGSQGALGLNKLVISALPKLARMNLFIRHQCGEAHLAATQAAYQQAEMSNSEVVPFIADMDKAYRWADLVICRAGATTIAELTVAGKPSLLVPFPHATHDHQTVNARFLAKRGAAQLLHEQETDGARLVKRIREVTESTGKLEEMAKAARSLGTPDAAVNLVEELSRMVSR